METAQPIGRLDVEPFARATGAVPTHAVLTNFPEHCFLSFSIYLLIFKREERAWGLFPKKEQMF